MVAVSKRKRLGQHALVDVKILRRIVDASEISADETVCEAGTGNGVLTRELCKKAKKVISFEVDKELFKAAQVTLGSFSNLELVNSDLFKKNAEFDVFVSNLPYSRSRDALRWLAFQKFDRAVIMVQQEFADKLTAEPESENYRAISVLAQTCFQINSLFVVSKKSFEPQPMVESKVLKLTPKRQASEKLVRNLEFLFSRRNKKIGSAFNNEIPQNFKDMRIYQLGPQEIVCLCDLMK